MRERVEQLLTSHGDNDNVLQTVNDVFLQYRNTCRGLVSNLHQLDFRSQCLSIFDFILMNVRYVEDPGNVQMIKTPDRTLKDGYADCKSMSVLAASCLWCLGVPEVRLRFVSFSELPTYTHVYAVATKDGETIIVDPVDRLNGHPQFDYARYSKKCKDYIYRQ